MKIIFQDSFPEGNALAMADRQIFFLLGESGPLAQLHPLHVGLKKFGGLWPLCIHA